MKAVIAALTDVEEALRGEYEPHDGKFRLKVEGEHPHLVPASKHAELNTRFTEFRDTNQKVFRALGLPAGSTPEEAIKAAEKIAPFREAKFDFATATAAVAKVADFEKKDVKDANDIDARITAAVTAAVGPIKQQLTAEQEARQKAENTVKNQTHRATLEALGKSLSVHDSALPDFVNRAMAIFPAEGGAKENGMPLFGANGEAMTPKEWAEGLLKTAPHLFGKSGGSGASPAPGQPQIRGDQKVYEASKLSPQELGRMSKDIAAGKVKIVDSAVHS